MQIEIKMKWSEKEKERNWQDEIKTWDGAKLNRQWNVIRPEGIIRLAEFPADVAEKSESKYDEVDVGIHGAFYV